MDLTGCKHDRAAVLDTDDVWDREGTKVIGKRELVECPDCDTRDWVPAR